MSSSHYKTKSPVLFILFNRPDTTLLVLEQIRLAKPERLYLTADGPRPGRTEEALKCAEVKAAVLAGVDWPCEVKTLFRKENLGPKEAVSSAITWFFEHEEEGIILEHDCLPAKSFFWFCDTMLEKYRFDTRVFLISGSNLSRKKWGDASYYFSQLSNAWGWAIWKRSWTGYDKDLTNLNEQQVTEQLHKVFDDSFIIHCWVRNFLLLRSGQVNTWDYQMTFQHFFGNYLNIAPNNNLVSNIGFGSLAENTIDAGSFFAAIPLEEMDEIIHPKFMLPEKAADHLILTEEFAPYAAYLKKHNSLRRRFKRWVKAPFQKNS
jgi:hypothetical protein